MLLATLLAAGASAPLGPPPSPVPARNVIQCTPWSVSFLEGELVTNDPIAAAMDRAGPGTTILLGAGDYRGFALGFRDSSSSSSSGGGGSAWAPVVIEGIGPVRILPHGGAGTTISISQQAPVGHVTFRNLEIVPGYSAAVSFFRETNRSHDGFVFEDCTIDGGYDHARRRGPKTKWGVWGHSLKDFVFRGTSRPAIIRNLRDEHAFYLQNPKGDITIENVQAERLGRTFLQLTSRASEGPPGRGRVVVRSCKVVDACIGAGDGFKGGAAFTFAGRHTGAIVLEHNSYRAGFDSAIRKLTLEGSPYGTGALVAWDGGENQRNGPLILRNNVFELADGCGDRPVVSIGATQMVRIVGRNRFVSGGVQPALELDPVRDATPDAKGLPKDSRLRGPANGQVYIDPATEVEGPVEMAGVAVDLSALLPKKEPPKPEAPKGEEESPRGGV